LSLLSLAEARELLAGPFAHEDVDFLAVDLADLTEPVDGLADDLLALPAVTVGVVEGPVEPRLAEVADAFDVVLGPASFGDWVGCEDPASELTALAEAAARNPHAALCLAQLLRIGRHLDIRDALVAESLTYSTLQSGAEFARWMDRQPDREADVESDLVLSRRDGSTLWLTLNRPQRHNAFNAPMRDQLVELLRVAAADNSIGGVVLEGAGPNFCSGGDLAEFGSHPDPATAHHVRSIRSAGWWLHQLGDRARVHVQGRCVGAGIELPAFTPSVIALDDATFRLPEVTMGLVPGAGGTASMTRRIGRQRMAWLALTGAEIDAPTALSWGLIDRIRDVR